MKKMTLAQKKRRLKEIQADLAKSAKKTHSFGKNILDALTKPPFSKPAYPVMTPNHYIRPHVSADKLPGEWVKLPPMQWPETLPAEVPIRETPFDDAIGPRVLNTDGIDVGTAIVIRCVWHSILDWKRADKKALQSAWTETLVRLGYTEDAE